MYFMLKSLLIDQHFAVLSLAEGRISLRSKIDSLQKHGEPKVMNEYTIGTSKEAPVVSEIHSVRCIITRRTF